MTEEDWPEAIPAFLILPVRRCMYEFFFGIDVSKEKFDACGIDDEGGRSSPSPVR